MITIRCDDLDPRIDVTTLKSLHSEFVKRNIPMTIAVNTAMGNRVGFDKDVLDYVNNSDPKTWDIQLHNFTHDRFWAMDYPTQYAYIYANLCATKRDFVHSNPTILYPPWNEKNDIMEQVCKELGITIRTTQKTIRELFKNWNLGDETLFFWHWWTKDDRDMLPDILDRLLVLNKQT